MPTTYNCSDPETVNKAYYVVDKSYYVDGDQVYYICYADYSMDGSPTLTCDGATGNWTGNYPKCSLTTTTVTTTTTTQPSDDWLYVGVGLMSFLALLFLLIVLLACIFLCYRLCRKRSKVSALHGIQEQLDVGCCYACCMRCCLKCCRCCAEDDDLKGNLTPQQRDTSVSPSSVVFDDKSGWTPKTIRKEVKPAKEITEWKPHSNPMRNINTSTK